MRFLQARGEEEDNEPLEGIHYKSTHCRLFSPCPPLFQK